MPHGFIEMLQALTGLIAGGLIGVGFGYLQEAARRHNEKRQAEGKLNSGWVLMPGSGARVAYLLITLVLIQIVCPLLFRDGIQWWVSGGVGLGYGFMLFLQLRRRLNGNK
jgi:MFS family permease